MTKRDWIERVKADPFLTYRRFEDIERDRRLKDVERIELLRAWPAADDFERGRVAKAIQAIEGKSQCKAGEKTQTP